MTKAIRNLSRLAILTVAAMPLTFASNSLWGQEQQGRLTVSDGVNRAHVFPTVNRATNSPVDNGPLLYHSGGAIMTGQLKFYAIYWIPAHLQDGSSTSLPSHYQSVQTNLAAYYGGHGIANNNTQYYQTINGTTTWILNFPNGLGGTYVDTNAYPAPGCTDSITGTNCITDAQIRTEIQRVMALKGWTGGINKMFLLFTSSGEGSCFDAGGSSCAYSDYCAYHSDISGSTPIIYGNEPYGDPNYCQTGGTPSPNNDVPADTAATAASHEMTEAITDPLLNAWYTAQGNEIGDLCAYDYGTNTYDSGKANQYWNGRYFELQTEFDNHVRGCVQVGP